ncbi:MAG: hypothetical protein IKK22_00570, partial [Firmicutes bacterium]|nr:hypothetical protein [Bacillota bacterium]
IISLVQRTVFIISNPQDHFKESPWISAETIKIFEEIHQNFSLDCSSGRWYNVHNLIQETVEAGITAMMPPQRACDAESQVRNKLSNGPLRVQ